jgi:hypothetical protein
MKGDSVQRRRDTILAAAGNALDAARARRMRRARIVTAAVVLAIAAVTTMLRPGRDDATPEPRTIAIDSAIHGAIDGAIDGATYGAIHGATHGAIDFAIVQEFPTTIDFGTVGSTAGPLLDTLTDDEVELALEESGYCARLMRVRDRVRLVDCSTGMPMVIRERRIGARHGS